MLFSVVRCGCSVCSRFENYESRGAMTVFVATNEYFVGILFIFFFILRWRKEQAIRSNCSSSYSSIIVHCCEPLTCEILFSLHIEIKAWFLIKYTNIGQLGSCKSLGRIAKLDSFVSIWGHFCLCLWSLTELGKLENCWKSLLCIQQVICLQFPLRADSQSYEVRVQ